MIDKVRFTGKGENDYINEIKYKVVEVKQKDEEKETGKRGHRFPSYRRQPKYEEIPDGKANPQLIRNLLGKTFEFSEDKVNVLFGPNGSGKTTILKAIAAHCLCGGFQTQDGWTSWEKYDSYAWPYMSAEKTEEEMRRILKAAILRDAGNECEVGWKGGVTYFNNFAARHSSGEIGDLSGTLLNGIEEVAYRYDEKSISDGEKSAFLFGRMAAAIKRLPTYAELTDEEEFRKKTVRVNDYWTGIYRTQLEYIKESCKGGDGERPTVMMDEIDRTLDVRNVLLLYSKILPQMRDSFKVQFIVVSHNPLVLSNLVLGNEKTYNVISLDEDYTRNTAELLHEKVKF